MTNAAVQAMKQGVPVITIDRDVNNPQGRDVFIGDNDKQLGILQTQYALQYLKTHNVPKPWNIAILQGTLGSSTAIDRLTGGILFLRNRPFVSRGGFCSEISFGP